MMIIMGYPRLAECFDKDIKELFIRGKITEIMNIGDFVEKFFSEEPKDKTMRHDLEYLIFYLERCYQNLLTGEGLEWLKKNYPVKKTL